MIVSPVSLAVTENQTATFYCSADSNPKPSVSWSKTNGVTLVNNGGQQNKLEVENVAFNDSGKYICTATNILGKVQKEVKLFVEGKSRAFLNMVHSFYCSFFCSA